MTQRSRRRIEDRVEDLAAKGRVFSEKQFNAILRVLHPDTRDKATAKEKDAAFDMIFTKRDILVIGAALKAKMKAKHAAAAEKAAAEGKPPPPEPEYPEFREDGRGAGACARTNPALR